MFFVQYATDNSLIVSDLDISSEQKNVEKEKQDTLLQAVHLLWNLWLVHFQCNLYLRKYFQVKVGCSEKFNMNLFNSTLFSFEKKF